MSVRLQTFLSRRKILAMALAVPAAAGAQTRPAVGVRPTVAILGDSITAGYGLPAAQSLPAQLEAALARLGRPARVRGAGVSGDTTAGGLSRVDFSVAPDTAVCVVALGGNDLLRGLEPRTTRANLDGIVRKLKARRIGVVLAGLKAPPVIGAGYAREFDAVFPAVARAHGVGFLPDLLEGVALNGALNQRDGVHPNAEGVKVLAARLAPPVARALGQGR